MDAAKAHYFVYFKENSIKNSEEDVDDFI